MATEENNNPLGGEEEIELTPLTPLDEYLELRRCHAEVADAIAKKLRKMMQKAERLAQDTRILIEFYRVRPLNSVTLNLAREIEAAARQLERLQALEEKMEHPGWNCMKFKSFLLIEEDGGFPREVTGEELEGIITALHKLRRRAAINEKIKNSNTIEQ